MQHHISALQAAALYDEAFLEASGIVPTLNISELLLNQEKKVLASLEHHLQDSLVIFDSLLNLFHTVYCTFKEDTSKNNDNLSFFVLSSKIFSLMLGLRKTLYSGFPDSYKCLYRPLIESFDTFYTSLINSEFSSEYGNRKETYDNNDFWYRKGRPEKIKRDLHRLFRLLGADDAFISAFDSRRKEQQRFLSEAIHSSFNASISTHFTPNLDGELKHEFGDVTIAFPNLLLETFDEAQSFIYILHTLCTKDNNLSHSFYQSFNNSVLFNYQTDRFALLYQTYRPGLLVLKDEVSSYLSEVADSSKKD